MTMSPRSSYYLSTLLLCFHPIFRPHALAASDTPGTLKFYNDYGCNNPSTINPTVALRLSTCLVTPGAEGVVIGALPLCPQGTAALIYYSDPACGVQNNNVPSPLLSDSCFELAYSPTLSNAKSLMFSCQPAANNPQPSSTTTAVVSALAAVATGSSGSDGGGSGSGSGSSTSSAGGSSSTRTNTENSGTGSAGSSSGGDPGTGLGTGDIIALVVGLGIGVPTIVIMVLAWRYPAVRTRVTALVHDWISQHPAFPHNQSQQGLHGRPQGLVSQPSTPQQWNYNHPHELASQRTWPQQWQYGGPQEMDARQQPFRPY